MARLARQCRSPQKCWISELSGHGAGRAVADTILTRLIARCVLDKTLLSVGGLACRERIGCRSRRRLCLKSLLDLFQCLSGLLVDSRIARVDLDQSVGD